MPGGLLVPGERVHRDGLHMVAERLGPFGEPGGERLLAPALDHVQQARRPIVFPGSEVDDDGHVPVRGGCGAIRARPRRPRRPRRTASDHRSAIPSLSPIRPRRARPTGRTGRARTPGCSSTSARPRPRPTIPPPRSDACPPWRCASGRPSASVRTAGTHSGARAPAGARRAGRPACARTGGATRNARGRPRRTPRSGGPRAFLGLAADRPHARARTLPLMPLPDRDQPQPVEAEQHTGIERARLITKPRGFLHFLDHTLNKTARPPTHQNQKGGF